MQKQASSSRRQLSRSSLLTVIASFTGSPKSSVTASSSRLISDSSEGGKVETGGVCGDEAMDSGWDGEEKSKDHKIVSEKLFFGWGV